MMGRCNECLHEIVCEFHHNFNGIDTRFCNYFKNKADVQEVKHGYWIKSGKPHDYDITCSLCGDVGEYGLETEDAVNDYYYCTNCGAKMDGGKNG